MSFKSKFKSVSAKWSFHCIFPGNLDGIEEAKNCYNCFYSKKRFTVSTARIFVIHSFNEAA